MKEKMLIMMLCCVSIAGCKDRKGYSSEYNEPKEQGKPIVSIRGITKEDRKEYAKREIFKSSACEDSVCTEYIYSRKTKQTRRFVDGKEILPPLEGQQLRGTMYNVFYPSGVMIFPKDIIGE